MYDSLSSLGFMVFWPILSVLQILSVVFSLLFMYHSARHRNQILSVGWYICGFLFGMWTLIAFLVKRKDFPGPDTKKCVQCGNVYPDVLDECQNCHVPLPQTDAQEKTRHKKLSRIFGIAAIVTYVAVMITAIVIVVSTVKNTMNYLDLNFVDEGFKISVDAVYYDKKGNSYEAEKDVLLYDEDGHVYTYTASEEIDDTLSYDGYYVREDGKKYDAIDCYVTQDGWFYCDKAQALEYYYADLTTLTEEELDNYYDELMEEEDAQAEYKYYDYPYMDTDGNVYYDALEASWNEKGELIVAENDIY